MQRIERIQPPDKAAAKRAASRWNGVAKPLHSLGLLEEALIRIAGMTGSEEIDLSKRRVLCLCADNGVVCEGVTQTDAFVTRIVAQAMAQGRSNINRMAQTCGADVTAVDVGMFEEEGGTKAEESPAGSSPDSLLVRKAACGTANIACGPAMTREQAVCTIQTGIDLAQESAAAGCRILITGEMGIGNTTTSSALASVLLGLPAEEVTGRGAGLSNAGLLHKCEVIKRAVQVNFAHEIETLYGGRKEAALCNVQLAGEGETKERKECLSFAALTELWQGRCADAAIDLLARLGGFDIAAMTGVYLGGAICRVPVVIDGFISAVAAVLAAQIAPLAKEYMLASHVSAEPAGAALLAKLGLVPCITAGLCLGEGTGGVLLLPMLDAALSVYRSAHRFDELPIEQYQEFSPEK